MSHSTERPPTSADSGDARLTPAAMLESLGLAVIATDPDGHIVLWNAAAETLYGWAASDVLGRDITDVTVPRMSQTVATEIMDALRHGVPWSGGFLVQRRDGVLFPALVTDAGVYHDGALVGVVGESMHLGTALRPLLERSSDAAIMLSAEGFVSYASPAVTTLFGWEADDLVGKVLTDHVHPEDQETFHELLHPDGDLGRERVGEIRVRSGDDWSWVEAAVSDMAADPEVRGLVCNLRRSERLTRLDERERLITAMHVDVLQDLFAATLELDRLLLRATSGQRPRLESAIDSVSRAIRLLREAVRPPEP